MLSAVLTLVTVGNGRVEQQGAALDSYAFAAVRGAFIYLVLFIPTHLALRRYQIVARPAYAAAGAVCALLSVAGQTPLDGWQTVIASGRISVFFGITLAAGAMLGFLYQWRAGLEQDGDDPERLAEAISNPAVSAAAADSGFGRRTEGAALVDAGSAEYFAGPTQVRTSVPLALTASLLSAGVYALAQFAIGVADEMSSHLHGATTLSLDMLGYAMNAQLHVLLFAGVLAPIPFSIAVLIGHGALRALNRQSYLAYALAGLVAPFLLVLIGGLGGLYFALIGVIPVVIAMYTYRNMAGLEPKPVREDIQVTDRRDLVGEDHPRRKYGRVIGA